MKSLRYLFFILIVSLGPGIAHAGQLVLHNDSQATITCTADGWTIATGYGFDWQITVSAGQTFHVGQNTTRAGSPVINWVSCGGLTTRMMNITPTSPDGQIFLNGQQTRVLNAALYPYLPTIPGGQFEALVAHAINTYQAANPEVLLAAQLNAETDIYSFTNLPVLLGSNGLDVVEMDVTYLGFVVSQNLINPVTSLPNTPLPVAQTAATVNGQLWAVPSWLCNNFIYAGDSNLQSVTTLSALLNFLTSHTSPPELVASYNGSWTLPSMYINAYVQQYGLSSLPQAMQMPPDSIVIANLIQLTDTCDDAGTNNCTNNTYHNEANGTTEQVFATGNAGSDMGFSEQSFFINYYGPVSPLYAVSAPWGPTLQPLMYADAFVSNSSTCAPGSQCAADATAFTTLMTALPMKNYIVESQDLAAGSPWRTLLVSTQAFYSQPQIQANPMYQQYVQAFPTAAAYPNDFTAAVQSSMAFGICGALQAQRPAYVCKTSASVGTQAPAPANDNVPATQVIDALEAAIAHIRGGANDDDAATLPRPARRRDTAQ